MWCPSVSLSVWANAWLAGLAAPDDVLDALSLWAPRHSVTAYDSVAAGRTGLPWPDLTDAGAVSLLQTHAHRGGSATGEPAISVVAAGARRRPGAASGHPVPDRRHRRRVRRSSCRAAGPDAVGLVPDFEYDDAYDDTDDDSRLRPRDPARCRGRCTRCRPRRSASTSTSARPSTNCASAVRSAADALGTLRAGHDRRRRRRSARHGRADAGVRPAAPAARPRA